MHTLIGAPVNCRSARIGYPRNGGRRPPPVVFFPLFHTGFRYFHPILCLRKAANAIIAVNIAPYESI